MNFALLRFIISSMLLSQIATNERHEAVDLTPLYFYLCDSQSREVNHFWKKFKRQKNREDGSDQTNRLGATYFKKKSKERNERKYFENVAETL